VKTILQQLLLCLDLTLETWVKTTLVDCWLKPHPLAC